MKKRWEFRKTMRNDTLKIHVAFFCCCSDAMCFFFCFYTLFCSALQRIVYMWECIFFWRFLSIKLSKKKTFDWKDKSTLFILHMEGCALFFSGENRLFSLICVQCYRMVWPLLSFDSNRYVISHYASINITYIDATSHLYWQKYLYTTMKQTASQYDIYCSHVYY